MRAYVKSAIIFGGARHEAGASLDLPPLVFDRFRRLGSVCALSEYETERDASDEAAAFQAAAIKQAEEDAARERELDVADPRLALLAELGAMTRAQLTERALAAGFEDQIPKRCTVAELRGLLAEWLSGSPA